MAEGKSFLNAKEVADILECSKSKSYDIIRQLNGELSEKGFIVLHGKVSKKYFYERIYQGEPS
ncbi:MAG: DNA-binding protein [Roseburia sp.]